MTKRYMLSTAELRDIATGRGQCIASDEIVVKGQPVRFMYREKPDNELDSGWRFLSGLESEEYLNDANNLGVYDVNTIANHDPRIVPFLSSPLGSAFERTDDQPFVEAKDFHLSDYDGPLH